MADITFREGSFLDPEQFAEDEELVEGTHPATGEPWIDAPALLFEGGKKRGRLYDEGYLDEVVRQFREPQGFRDWEVPVQLDHSDSARETYGHVRKVYRRALQLRGRIRLIGDEPVRRYKNGTWRRLSVQFRQDKSLKETSITPFPYVRAASFSEGSHPMGDDTKKETTPPAEGQEEKKAPTEEKKPEVKPEPAPEQFKDEPEAVRKMREEFSAKTAAMEARMVELEKSNAEQAKAIRFAELTKTVDAFTEGGLTVPAMRDKELALLETFSDEQLKLYGELKETQPKFVDFSVRGFQDSGRPGTDDVQTEAKRLAESY